MIKVWGRRTSSNVQAVLWCLAELDLPYERVDAGFNFGLVDQADYLALNPNGLVPTLIDGDDAPLWESGAIVRYLATRYGTDPFWPADPAARAQVDKWAEWGKVTFAAAFTGPIFWQVVRTAPSKQDPAAIDRAIANVSKVLQIADAQLEGRDFLLGDDLTLADIQFGHCLYRYFTIDIDRPDLPDLAAYYQRLSNRPAFRDNVMVSYEILRVTD